MFHLLSLLPLLLLTLGVTAAAAQSPSPSSSSSYDICCHLFTVNDNQLSFNSLSKDHGEQWQRLGYVPKVYVDMMTKPNRFVVIPVDEPKTAYYFLNSPNNYTRCFDCQRINRETNEVSTSEEDRRHWMANYIKITQHDYVVCQSQLDSQNWTTVYLAAAISIVLFILFFCTAVFSWLYANITKFNKR